MCNTGTGALGVRVRDTVSVRCAPKWTRSLDLERRGCGTHHHPNAWTAYTVHAEPLVGVMEPLVASYRHRDFRFAVWHHWCGTL